MKVDQTKLYVPGDVLETLIRCKGYYKQRIIGPQFQFLRTPVVGYAGTYGQEPKKHFVGFEYFNCAKAEQYPFVRHSWAEELKKQWDRKIPDVVLGAPMGGILFADSVATAFGCRVVFAEKKIKARSETPQGRDETELVLDRHEIEKGDVVVIAEDVCNNFSTTSELVRLITSCGATPSAVACIVNRSGLKCAYPEGMILPVGCLGFIPTQQFEQEDARVADDIGKGNVVWKPKSRENWAKLMEFMEQGGA